MILEESVLKEKSICAIQGWSFSSQIMSDADHDHKVVPILGIHYCNSLEHSIPCWLHY